MHLQAVTASFLPSNGEKNMKYDFISITFLNPEYQTDGNNYRWEYISHTRSQMLHSSPIEIWNESLHAFSLSGSKLVKKGRWIWPGSSVFPWLPWRYYNSNLLWIQPCLYRNFGFFLITTKANLLTQMQNKSDFLQNRDPSVAIPSYTYFPE